MLLAVRYNSRSHPFFLSPGIIYFVNDFFSILFFFFPFKIEVLVNGPNIGKWRQNDGGIILLKVGLFVHTTPFCLAYKTCIFGVKHMSTSY